MEITSARHELTVWGNEAAVWKVARPDHQDLAGEMQAQSDLVVSRYWKASPTWTLTFFGFKTTFQDQSFPVYKAQLPCWLKG